MKSKLNTVQRISEVSEELKKREPIFHHPEYGITRQDFEKMTEETFWEVGASGSLYSRNFVLDTLEERYKNPQKDEWEISDFNCEELAVNNYLVTYTLIQNNVRITRRSTIWRRHTDGWKIVYHQGTIVKKSI
jgi:hypothetical protein